MRAVARDQEGRFDREGDLHPSSQDRLALIVRWRSEGAPTTRNRA